MTGMRYLLESLGFIVNTKKSVLNPAQVIEFLGLSVDSIAMEIRLPPVKIKQIRAEAHKLARQETVSACTTIRQDKCHKLCPSTRAPVLSSATNGTNEAKFPVLRSTSPLAQECLEQLKWWDNNMCRWNGKALI